MVRSEIKFTIDSQKFWSRPITIFQKCKKNSFQFWEMLIFLFIFIHFGWNRSFSFSTISIVWTVFKCILHTKELHSIKVKIHVAWRNYEGRKSHKENSFSSWILLNQSTRIPPKEKKGGTGGIFFAPVTSYFNEVQN